MPAWQLLHSAQISIESCWYASSCQWWPRLILYWRPQGQTKWENFSLTSFERYMKAVPVPSSSSNLLSSRNQVLESKSLLCYNCFRFQSFMDFLCKDSTTLLHTTVEVVLTFTNVTLNFTTPLNESSAMSYGTLLYTKRRAKRATVAAKKAKQQLFDSHFLCILILMKI